LRMVAPFGVMDDIRMKPMKLHFELAGLDCAE
jgi:hypothetical protein